MEGFSFQQVGGMEKKKKKKKAKSKFAQSYDEFRVWSEKEVWLHMELIIKVNNLTTYRPAVGLVKEYLILQKEWTDEKPQDG